MLLSVICALSVFAQQTLTVSGTVKDDAGEPLIGVVVAVALYQHGNAFRGSGYWYDYH